MSLTRVFSRKAAPPIDESASFVKCRFRGCVREPTPTASESHDTLVANAKRVGTAVATSNKDTQVSTRAFAVISKTSLCVRARNKDEKLTTIPLRSMLSITFLPRHNLAVIPTYVKSESGDMWVEYMVISFKNAKRRYAFAKRMSVAYTGLRTQKRPTEEPSPRSDSFVKREHVHVVETAGSTSAHFDGAGGVSSDDNDTDYEESGYLEVNAIGVDTDSMLFVIEDNQPRVVRVSIDASSEA
eukprot:m.461679 g.461679  ORF g.461679 m.461679 type:complete len:242 (+) comp22375_c0_seq1:142-867(+)